MDTQVAVGEEQVYLLNLGRQLRAARRAQGLSLKVVEAMTNGEFKASALGAYERAQRTISVVRLHRLARFYAVPVDRLLPADNQVGVVIDLREGTEVPLPT